MNEVRRQIFEGIYSSHSWGGSSRSGPGSDPEHTVSYVGFVNKWLAQTPDCRQVVELGCGDWATSRLINFLPHQTYLGLDVVRAAIDSNRVRFEVPNVRFECCDFLSQVHPGGDLLLIKDVLQHLSNHSVQEFLEKVLPRYRYALITNDIARCEDRRFFGVVLQKLPFVEANADAPDGGSRPFKLDESPFCLKVIRKFRYPVVLRKEPPRVVYEKEILVWRNGATANDSVRLPGRFDLGNSFETSGG